MNFTKSSSHWTNESEERTANNNWRPWKQLLVFSFGVSGRGNVKRAVDFASFTSHFPIQHVVYKCTIQGTSSTSRLLFGLHTEHQTTLIPVFFLLLPTVIASPLTIVHLQESISATFEYAILSLKRFQSSMIMNEDVSIRFLTNRKDTVLLQTSPQVESCVWIW